MKSSKLIAAAAAILLSGTAQAATTISTVFTMNNAAIALSGTNVTITGPCSLTNGIGNGTFSASLSITAITSATISVPFTITLSSGDKITGTASVPSALLFGSPGTASATITGGTGAYANATGSFPSLTGSGSFTGTSGSLSLTGTGTITTGGPPAAPVPTITGVVDAGSYTPSVAQGSVFVVKGTALSPTSAGYNPFGFPLPTNSGSSLGSVSINFTPLTGGTATPAYLIYLYNVGGVNQLAAILPSTFATGTYNVTVNASGSTSAPFVMQVVQRKPALITADSTGSGLAVIQNYVSASQLDVNRFTKGSVGGFTISPAYPGQTEIAYLVGTGADPGPDNQASPGYNFLTNGVTAQILVGGMQITPTYLGRVGGGQGYEQVNFVLPANVQTGCTVPFQLIENGIASLPTFIAIAPNASAAACVQPGFTTAQLQAFDNGAATNIGAFTITQLTETVPSFGTIKLDAAQGGFTKYPGAELSALAAAQAYTTLPTGCVVTPINGTQAQVAAGTGIGLDAGTLTLTGPTGSNLTNTPFTELNNVYSLQIGSEGLPAGIGTGGNGKIVPGTYSMHGAGGTGVGPFDAKVNIGSPLIVTGGLPTAVTRSAGLTLNWTGGGQNDPVEIFGSAYTLSGTGTNAVETGAGFVCFTTAGRLTYTVDSSILNQLPAVSQAQISNGSANGFLAIYTFGIPTSGNGLFSAPLVAGGSIDNSTFLGLVGSGSLAAYQ